MRTSSEKEQSDKCLNNTWTLLNDTFFFFYHKTEICITAFFPTGFRNAGGWNKEFQLQNQTLASMYCYWGENSIREL